MLDRAQCVSLFGGALRALREEIDRVTKDWAPDEVPFTVLMGALGSVLSRIAEGLSEDDLGRIAALIELALTEGDEETDTAVATGLLEALVNHDGCVRLVKRLGPEARAYCKAWDDFTGAKTPGLDD